MEGLIEAMAHNSDMDLENHFGRPSESRCTPAFPTIRIKESNFSDFTFLVILTI